MHPQDFLVELGTQELPPTSLTTLSQAFADNIAHALNEQHISCGPITPFATPRRLAVYVQALHPQQADQVITRKGPSLTAAYRDGEPTPAAMGFARSCGVALDDLIHGDDHGGRLIFRQQQVGQKTISLLPQIVQSALDRLPIAKRMHWGAKNLSFVRPTQWLVMLYGSEIVPATLLGQTADRISWGHRVHHHKPILIEQPNTYVEQLRKAYVLVDFNERRAVIKQQLLAEAKRHQGILAQDDALLDEVCAINEWPVALTGSFDREFLQVPSEALISSMKNHQKYFPILNKQQQLLPYFITVANLVSKDPAQVITGNERVIRPRLADARFFFDQDRTQSLEERCEALKTVVFQEQLGSVWDKTQRMVQLATHMAEQIGENPQTVQSACELSKADLTTDMVQEFPELQGIMGDYYAQHDGEDLLIAKAIREHYLPRFADDSVPETITGALVALADRLDNLVGVFAIGKAPTGSKDPFGLRRAAQGLIRIIIHHKLPFTIKDLLLFSIVQYQQQSIPVATLDMSSITDALLPFIGERMRSLYQDQGIENDVFTAVHALALPQLYDMDCRIQAVQHFSSLPAAMALAAANKRVANLLAKVSDTHNDTLQQHLLIIPAEQQLALAITTHKKATEGFAERGYYTEILQSLARLQEPVDAFFDEVLVLCEDADLRNNRLALLQQLRNLFLAVADIALLNTGQ